MIGSIAARRVRCASVALVCLWTLLLGFAAQAQNSAVHVSQLAHKAWRLREGDLPGAPNAIAQTTDGYIWIGTDNGLYRFDGDSYQLFDAAAPNHIIRVQSLLASRDGSLWVGAGTSVYHLRQGTLHKMPGVNKVLQMFQLPSGDIWISTENRSKLAACRIQGEVFECPAGLGMDAGGFSIASDGSNGYWVSNSNHLRHRTFDGTAGIGDAEIPWTGIIDVLGADGRGKVWAGVHEQGKLARLFEQDGQGWKPLPVLPGLRHSSDIQSIFADKEGALWVGTSDVGVYRITKSGVDRFNQSDGLTNDQVADITQDAEGSIWLATSGGIDQFHRSLVDSWSTKEGLSGDSVSAIVADRSGRIWMSNTGGLDCLENGVIHSYRPGEGLPGTAVAGIALDHQGRVWVGIDDGLWILDKGNFERVLTSEGKSTGQIVDMQEDALGQMWIKTGTKKLFRFSGGVLQQIEWQGAGLITVLHADPTDGMWIGARNMPAFHVPSGSLKITTRDSPSVGGDSFKSIFSTDGKMLSQTTREIAITGEEKTAVLNQQNGLDYRIFFSSALAQSGDVYLMTEKSYLLITADNFHRWLQDPKLHVPSRVIGGRDGAITGNATFGPSNAVAPNGDLWFATDRFPQRIVPAKLGSRAAPPNMRVEAVTANGDEMDLSQPLVLKAGTPVLDIHFVALTFVNPQTIQYKYLLEGYDTDWQLGVAQKHARYNHLPPGDYRFRVMASDENGTWTSQESVAEFKVLPHFYQTTWFKVLLFVVGLFALWIVYLARLRYLIGQAKAKIYERMSERERIARDLHDTFFQGIQGLLLRFQTGTSALPAAEPVRPMFEDLLKQSDQVMHEGRELVLDLRVRFAEDEDLAQAFARVCAELEPVFPAKYSVIIQGKPKPLETTVSEEVFRIGKEAITNAFQHSGANKIEVEISFEERDLKVRVRDDGRGIDPGIQQAGGRPGHFGLTGMRERAQKIGAKLDIWSQGRAGTEIELHIPSALTTPAASRAFAWLMQLRDRQV
jgi:signal transduction histidine kinase/ligand-binding sensor domain-containing protein